MFWLKLVITFTEQGELEGKDLGDASGKKQKQQTHCEENQH